MPLDNNRLGTEKLQFQGGFVFDLDRVSGIKKSRCFLAGCKEQWDSFL